MRIWDVLLCKVVMVLSGHTHSVTGIKWGGEGLIYTSSQDRTIKVWRAKDVSSFIMSMLTHVYYMYVQIYILHVHNYWEHNKDTIWSGNSVLISEVS